MARIFTTRFTFNQKLYDAIVTMITSDGKINFSVKLLDDGLHDLFPGGQIRYEGKEGFRNVEANDQLTKSLIHCLASSIEQHLILQP